MISRMRWKGSCYVLCNDYQRTDIWLEVYKSPSQNQIFGTGRGRLMVTRWPAFQALSHTTGFLGWLQSSKIDEQGSNFMNENACSDYASVRTDSEVESIPKGVCGRLKISRWPALLNIKWPDCDLLKALMNRTSLWWHKYSFLQLWVFLSVLVPQLQVNSLVQVSFRDLHSTFAPERNLIFV